MFCSKCGKQIPDGASFCQGCGKPVNTAGLPRPMHQAEQPTGTAQPAHQAEQPTGTAQPAHQAEQPTGIAQSMPHVVGRPTAPLPAEQPVECPVCGMLAYSGQSHCLICDADLGAAVPPERGAGQEFQQASTSEQTSNQEREAISESVQQQV